MASVAHDQDYATPAECVAALQSWVDSACATAGILCAELMLAIDGGASHQIAAKAVRDGDVILLAHGWQTVAEAHYFVAESYVEIHAGDLFRLSEDLPVIALREPTDEQRSRFGGWQ